MNICEVEVFMIGTAGLLLVYIIYFIKKQHGYYNKKTIIISAKYADVKCPPVFALTDTLVLHDCRRLIYILNI